MATNNTQMTEEELRRLAQSLSRLVDSVDNTRQSHGPFADAMREATKEQESNTEKTKRALKQLASEVTTTAISFSKAVFSSEEGLGKFGNTVEGASNAAGNLVGSFGFLGTILGGIIKLFGQVAAASLKQNDALMKAYRDFADVGNISGSIEKLQSDLYKFGLTSFEADKLGKILKEVAPELSSFGGSVTVGKDRFTQVFEGMIGVGNRTEQMLGKLGYSTQDMREATADYIARQTRLGLAQNKTTDQLRQESVRYMGTLAELRELTGMSRDEAQKALDQQMKDARWAMTLREIEATQGKEAADKAAAGMVAFEKKFGSDAAMGLMEQIANKGAIVGEASARIDRATLGQAYSQFTNMVNGNVNEGDMIGNISRTVVRNLDSLNGAFKISGDGIKDLTGDYALINGSLGNANTKTVDTHGRLQEAMKSQTGRLEQNIALEQRMREMRIWGDQQLMKVGTFVINMFEQLLDVMRKFAKFMATFIDKMSNSALGKWLGISPTNLAEMFKDTDDYKADLAEASKTRANVEKQLADIKAKPQFNTGQEYNTAIDTMVGQLSQKSNEMARIRSTGGEGGITTPEGRARLKQLEEEHEALRLRLENLKDEREKVVRGLNVVNKETQNAIRQKELQEVQKKLQEEDSKIQEIRKKLTSNEVTSQINKTGINPLGNQPAKIGTGASAWNTDEKGQSVSPEVMAQRQAAQQDNTMHGFGRGQEILSKLNFGGKEKERTGGGAVDPSLLGLAEKVSEIFPGATFTAMNDLFHKRNRPDSRHTEGKALDFVLPTPPKDANEANEIRKQLKNLGATKVLDEYFSDKNDNTKGGHFHLEVAKMGGLFKGPESGYPVMLHGKNESAWPEQKLQGLLQDVEKSSIEKYKQELMDKMGLSDYNKNNQTASLATNDTKQMEDLFNRMITKFDTLIALQDKSNNISDELLTYTRA